MPLATGASVGPYEILGPLGSGGMGEVYRARDTRLGRLVAIKCLTGTGASDDARARVLDEARSIAALNHPHICTIHEVADIDQQLFIVMEHIDGRRLSDVVAESPAVATAHSIRHSNRRRGRPRSRSRYRAS